MPPTIGLLNGLNLALSTVMSHKPCLRRLNKLLFLFGCITFIHSAPVLGIQCSSLFSESLQLEHDLVNLPFGSSIPEKIWELSENLIAQALVNRFLITEKTLTSPSIGKSFDYRRSTQTLLLFHGEALPQILQSGRFKNIHETGDSSGWKLQNFRRAIENRIMGLDLGKSQKANEVRPKSAILNFPMESPPTASVWPSAYGDIVAVAKDELKSRTTWTEGDSAILMKSFYEGSFAKNHNLAVDYLKAGHNNLPRELHSFQFDKDTAEDWNGVSIRRHWFEAQIWGSFKISDIKEFWIPLDTPKELVELLISTKIPIFFQKPLIIKGSSGNEIVQWMRRGRALQKVR